VPCQFIAPDIFRAAAYELALPSGLKEREVQAFCAGKMGEDPAGLIFSVLADSRESI
jgi:hypothetical protein